MVIDDTAGLQMGIDRNRSDVFEAAPLQVFADAIVVHRNPPLGIVIYPVGLVPAGPCAVSNP